MKGLLTITAVAAICAMPLTVNADLAGLWEFENAGALTQATIGSDLALTGSEAAVAGSGGPDTGAAQVGNGDFYTAADRLYRTHRCSPHLQAAQAVFEGGLAGLHDPRPTWCEAYDLLLRAVGETTDGGGTT